MKIDLTVGFNLGWWLLTLIYAINGWIAQWVFVFSSLTNLPFGLYWFWQDNIWRGKRGRRE